MDWPALSAAVLVAAVTCLVGTGVVLASLRRRAIFDHPNRRSSHTTPTPRGGGLAVIPVILVGWAAAAMAFPTVGADALVVIIACLPLVVVSRLDDLGGVAPVWRLIVQAMGIAGALVLAPLPGPVFQGYLPGVLDTVAAAVLWMWFVNLFNFMDGIDGIAGTETVSIGLGLICVAAIVGTAGDAAILSAIVVGAAIGFLWWNRPPARIFLGDVGSVPLGFLLGWLLLEVAARGEWAAALILPLYYLADATLTLLRRLLRGARVWEAHREHFYQQAVRDGRGHGAVLMAVGLVNVILVVLAVAAAGGWPGPALIAAAVVVVGLLDHLAARRLWSGLDL